MRQSKIKVRKYCDRQPATLEVRSELPRSWQAETKVFRDRSASEIIRHLQECELRRNGIFHAEFPERLRLRQQNAVEQLRPFGKTIRRRGCSLRRASESEREVMYGRSTGEGNSRRQGKDGLSERHLRDLRSRLVCLPTAFDGKPVATITAPEIDDWLRSLPVSPLTRNNYRQRTALAFNFAIRRDMRPAIRPRAQPKRRW
jgi:hypothetical protein